MAEQTSDHLKVRACLLVLMCLWQWTQQILATTCSDGELRVISKGEKKCCPKCISNTGQQTGAAHVTSFVDAEVGVSIPPISSFNVSALTNKAIEFSVEAMSGHMGFVAMSNRQVKSYRALSSVETHGYFPSHLDKVTQHEGRDNTTCQNTQDHDCRCRQGYSCVDSACLYCQKLPECAAGEELVKLGNVDFIFRCKPCEMGTYSNVKNGWCRNWTDCESSGFLTVKQGNSTHNAVCGLLPKEPEQGPITIDSLSTTILAILTAVALFVLILLTFVLHFCIWSLKKEKYHAADDLEHIFPKQPMAPQLSHYREETYSCQLPEEEHGGKTPEEKHCYFHRQSLQ